ncbi:MAG: EAL domain-containing protein, partial [Lachnospiraceae bacterium]
KYRIPAGCICAEITETMVAENREEMGQVIRGFHEAGFEIWLDDFGAEYSSLSSLHRSPFDLIKLDMGFFQNFDDKSRAILTNLVSMAKDLGMHTLAEGVETKEQVDFLRGIGCERIQGYYYGRPEPYAELFAKAGKQGLVPENELERSIFDALGLVNLVSQTPTALFFMKGKTLRVLAANSAFWPELNPEGGVSLVEVNRILEDPAFRQNGRFLAGAGRVFRNGEADMIAVLRGEYLRFHAEKIAGVEGFWAGRCTLINMRYDQEIGEAKQLDRIFRHLIPLYRSICLTDPVTNTLQVFFSSYRGLDSLKTVQDASGAVRRFSRQFVDPSDRERFLAFYQEVLTETRARESLFRMRGRDGTFRWCVYTAIPVTQKGRRCVLFCSRVTVMEKEKSLSAILPAFVASFGGAEPAPEREETLQQQAALFRAIVGDAGIPMYWKNPHQRYLGMNTAFCQLTGLPDPEHAVGRTAEELGLYLDAEVPKKQEQKVLQGDTLPLISSRTFFARGKVHTSRFLEVPFYQGKQVAGLIGFALELPGQESTEKSPLLDAADILHAGMTLDDACRRTGRGYCAVLLLLQNFEDLCRTFGEDFAGKAADEIRDALLAEELPRDGVAGRLATQAFILLSGEKSAEGIVRAAGRVEEKIAKIRGISGTPCRLSIVRTMGVGRETESFPSLLRLLSLRAEPLRSRERTALDEVWQMVGIRREIFDRIPERTALVDSSTKELVFLNKALLRDLDLQENFTPEGATCYGLLRGRTEPCSDCALRREYYTTACTWESADRKYLSRNLPVSYLGRQLSLFVAKPASEDASYGSMILDSETWANEAITTGLEERDPDLGIRKCIAHIAENLKAERFFIFEERSDGTAACTYEWTGKGLLPWKGELSSVLQSNLAALYEIFRTNKVAIVENYAEFAAENPDFSLPIPGIENFISGRLSISGEPLGFTLVLNSPDCRPAGYML